MSLPFPNHDTKKDRKDDTIPSTFATTMMTTAAAQYNNDSNNIYQRGNKNNINESSNVKKMMKNNPTRPTSFVRMNALAKILPKQQKKCRFIFLLFFVSAFSVFHVFHDNNNNGGGDASPFQVTSLETHSVKQHQKQQNGMNKEESGGRRDVENDEKTVQSVTTSSFLGSNEKKDDKEEEEDAYKNTILSKQKKTKKNKHPNHDDQTKSHYDWVFHTSNGNKQNGSEINKIQQQEVENIKHSKRIDSSMLPYSTTTTAQDKKLHDSNLTSLLFHENGTPTRNLYALLLEATPYIVISTCSIVIDFTLYMSLTTSSSSSSLPPPPIIGKIIIFITRITSQVVLLLSNTIAISFDKSKEKKIRIMALTCYVIIGFVLLLIFCEVGNNKCVTHYNNRQRRRKRQKMEDERNQVTFNSMPVSSSVYSTLSQSSSSSPIISSAMSRINYASTGKNILLYMRLCLLSFLCIPYYTLSSSSSSLEEELMIGCTKVFLITFVSLLILKQVYTKWIYHDGSGKHVHFNLSEENEYIYNDKQQRDEIYNNGMGMMESGAYGNIEEGSNQHVFDYEENDARYDYHDEQWRRRRKNDQNLNTNSSATATSSPLEGWEDLLKSNTTIQKTRNNINGDDFKNKQEELLHHRNQIAMKQMRDLLQEKFGANMSLATFDTNEEDDDNNNGDEGHTLEKEGGEGIKQRPVSLPPEIQAIASRRPDLVQMFKNAAEKKEHDKSLMKSLQYNQQMCENDDDGGGGKIGACKNDQVYDSNDALSLTQRTNQNTAKMPSSSAMMPTAIAEGKSTTALSLKAAASAKKDIMEDKCEHENAPSSLHAASISSAPTPSSSYYPNSLLDSMPPHIREIAIRRPDLVSQMLSTRKQQVEMRQKSFEEE
uniref:Uncharacterized protein n=1 Tax=Helicotheca tamesis TaxID=374047 RepID=A0A7S2MNP8_9STRA|mmetsp:Transcript_19057/g.26243  ORF Transcript_19057/g.26243 Transcript_19057/m.26243 type:complete len:882 (+) Transcript_19057:79-2724(+)